MDTTQPTTLEALALAEFDIEEGNVLSCKFPEDVTFSLSDDAIANLCLPDGAHMYKEDATYLILSDGEGRTLYGFSLFVNRADATVKRGAIQKALLLVSRTPWFSSFESLLREAINAIMEGNDAFEVLRTAFQAVNTVPTGAGDMLLPLWGTSVALNMAPPPSGQFGGIGLKELVRLAGEDVLLLWYAVLHQKRVMVEGTPAKLVGGFVLAISLLVAPLLAPFPHVMTPYVGLNDLSALEEDCFIVGTTNPILLQDQGGYDVSFTLEAGIRVNEKGIRLSGFDKEFMSDVLSRMEEQTEEWIQEQFRRYTDAFLKALETDKLRGQHKNLVGFKDTEMYAMYVEGQYVNVMVATPSAPVWLPNGVVKACHSCEVAFSTVRRKHHCRACGSIFCSSCCGIRTPAPEMGLYDPVRICNTCADKKKEEDDVSIWVKDKDQKRCGLCDKSFSPIRRRHHCRSCGLIFCTKCCKEFMPLPEKGFNMSVRVCQSCAEVDSEDEPYGSTKGTAF